MGKARTCQSNVETQVPAIQAEQVAEDVAPVTAEYVPAKATIRRQALSEVTKGEGEKVGGRGHDLYFMPGDMQDKSTGQGMRTIQ